jgi:hypothetical protein
MPLFALALASVVAQQAPAAVPAALVGRWDCAGRFVRSGKPIAATVMVSAGENPDTLLITHRDKPPTSYRADELWVLGAGARAAIADASGMRWFDVDVAPGKVVLARGDDKGPVEKFVYTLDGNAALTIDWWHRGAAAELVPGDTITCRRPD